MPDDPIKPIRYSADHRGPGFRVRLRRIKGVTEKGVLEDGLRLPVLLGDFSVTEDADHRDYGTVSAGEFSSPAPGKGHLLRSTDLETLTIDWYRYAHWLTDKHRSPRKVRQELQDIHRSRSPFELLVFPKGGNPELRMYATIRSLSRMVRPGEADTRYFTLTIKEWRDNDLTVRSSSALDGGRSGSGKPEQLPKTIKLDDTMTLRSLADEWYGTQEGWRLIAQANGLREWGGSDVIVSSKKFKVGDKLQIPRPKETWKETGRPTYGEGLRESLGGS